MTPQGLKNSILKKAFTGKISVQHKYEYVDESKIDYKKNKNIKDFEFDLPANWALSTIEGISKTVSTKKYQIKQKEVLSDGDFPVISQSNDFITGYYNDLNKVYKNRESVVIFGDHTTVIKYIDFDFIVGADGVKIFEPFSIINAKYLYYCLSFITIGLDKLGRYSRHYKFIKDEAIPVPPLAEQERIVEKIEDLMPLVDEYEKNWQRLEDLNKNFPEDMKKSLLQEAIKGKLVEQRPGEGTGEELYKLINENEIDLIERGIIKSEKELLPIKEEEHLFEIPKSWTWVRFGKLGRFKKGPFGSALTKDKFVPKGKNTIKVYEQKNAIRKDATIGDYYITKEYFEEKLSGFLVSPGDILVSCAGTIGETFVMPQNIEKGIINQALMRMKLFEHINLDFFLLYFNYVLKNSAKKSSKGSAIKNIPPFSILKNYLVPLPPLAEQKRIVEKLEELLPLCDQIIKSDN